MRPSDNNFISVCQVSFKSSSLSWNTCCSKCMNKMVANVIIGISFTFVIRISCWHFYRSQVIWRRWGDPEKIYLFKVNNKENMCKICSKLTIKISERRQCCFSVFIVNFERISSLVPVYLVLNIYLFAGNEKLPNEKL